MNIFSISQLQQYSGIRAHTIRIWEQRYNALTPSRTEGNTRFYDGAQLRRLLNIVSLMNREHKVSELCTMPDSQLFKMIDSRLNESQALDKTAEYFVSQLVSAVLLYNEPHFEKIFSNALLRFGMKDSYTKVIYPMLVRIGMMWASDSLAPAQEHFGSNLIRQKLFSAIDALPPPASTRDSWLLFLPENEFHEIGLLFSYYMIRLAGKKAIYLGGNIPLDILGTCVNETHPRHLLFFLVQHDLPENSQKQLNKMIRNFSKIRIHVAGNEKLIEQLKIGKNVQWIQSVEDLETELYNKSTVYI